MADQDTAWSYEFEKSKTLKAGQLLLSEPFMYDENFRRTVVLVCEHTLANGTIGLILNKPINLRLNDLVEDFPPFNDYVFLGGPVGTESIQFLHASNGKIEHSIQLADNLYWGGNFNQLKELMVTGELQPAHVRFYLGYSGWSANQLLDEMKESSWILAPVKSSYIFKSNFNNLWKDVMQNMGGVYATMAGYPQNPILN